MNKSLSWKIRLRTSPRGQQERVETKNTQEPEDAGGGKKHTNAREW